MTPFVLRFPVRLRLCLLATLAPLCAPVPAAADDRADQVPATFAIQNRQYVIRHELHVAVGVLPINAFTKGVTVGGGYTFHFNNVLAWEIAQFNYSLSVDTSLKKDLLENFQVAPTRLDALDLFASSAVVFKPFYGKLALLNRTVVHLELFFVLGPAVGKYAKEKDPSVGFTAGAGLRFHVARHFSLRLDVRDDWFSKAASLANELHVSLSGALTFGGGT